MYKTARCKRENNVVGVSCMERIELGELLREHGGRSELPGE